jgi:hypothetical protein
MITTYEETIQILVTQITRRNALISELADALKHDPIDDDVELIERAREVVK